MVNWEFFDDQTPESAKQLVDDLIAGREVRPTRGAPLCTYRQTARILAGFPDERAGAVEATGGAGPASLAGLRLHRGELHAPKVVGQREASPRDDAGTYDTATSPSPAQHPSSHDAPAQTAQSDPAHPSDPVADHVDDHATEEEGE
jgi:NADH-quinone oxidoreductase subunit E